MFDLFKTNFTRCPHFERRHLDTTEIKNLKLAHRKIIIRLEKMSRKDDELYAYLKKHMDEEGHHHSNTKDALVELAGAVKTLIDDKKERDEDRDKRERRRDKIFTSVAIVVIIGIGKLLLDLYATTTVLGIGIE